MRRDGFTLIELLVVSTLLIVATGAIWQAWLSGGESLDLIERHTTATENSTRAIAGITRALRPASHASVSALPAARIAFKAAEDRDGNALAVDKDGVLELSDERSIGRDSADANHDGIKDSQLVLVSAAGTQVLANGIAADEDANGNGALDAGEDQNNNGALDRGVWFEQSGRGVLVTVQAAGKSRRGFPVASSVQQLVVPRNK